MHAWTAEMMSRLPGVRMTPDAPLSAYTTLRLGGPADLLAEPASAEEITALLRAASEMNVPVTVIGRGSNLLVRDGGVRGLTLRVANGMRKLSVDG